MAAKASTTEGLLSIKDWQLGIGESPNTGFGQMVNVDIFSKPGCVKISRKMILDPGAIGLITDMFRWDAQDPRTADMYFVDRGGKVYKRTTSGTWSVIGGHGVIGATGQGISVWKDYLFYARAQKIDVYGPLSGAPIWTNDWQTILASDFHPMKTTEADALYIGNANFVDTAEQLAGQIFDPTNSGTYIYNSQDLELASYYRIKLLEPLGSDMSIGTDVANGIVNLADLFFWDGFSDFIYSSKTVHFAENGVQLVKNMGNTLYSIAGLGNPRLFASVVSQATEIKRFNNITLPPTTSVDINPGATDQLDGELLLGIGHATGVIGAFPVGIYSYRQIDGRSAYTLRYLISTQSDGSINNLLIGLVTLINPTTILTSWIDPTVGSTYGVDILSNTICQDYTAYIESPLYTVGTEDDPRTFEEVEVRLAKKFKTGDGIKIFARQSLDDAWTIISTVEFSKWGARYAIKEKVENVSRMVNAQFRIELTSAPNSTESLELREIIFT